MIKVSEILSQKITEIQSRLPIKLNNLSDNTSDTSFSDILKDKIDGLNIDPLTNNSPTTSTTSSTKNSYMPSIEDNIMKASAKYKIDSNLMKAIIKQESDFDPLSLSSAGAQGLMQLMPGTAKALKVNNPWDIAQNIDGGVRYIKDQLYTFKDLRLALAAYNAGPQAVKKYNGVPPYKETQDYVNKVIGYYNKYSKE